MGHGEPAALEQLTPQVYHELHKLSRATCAGDGLTSRSSRPRRSMKPTCDGSTSHSLSSGRTAHFFGIAARLMRMILVAHARTHRAAKRGGAAAAVTLDDGLAVATGRAPDVLEVDEALNSLAAVDERKAKVIEMRYFGGVDREEVAAALGLTLATVKRDLRLGEAWLRKFRADESPKARVI
jgi:hypothetical protein